MRFIIAHNNADIVHFAELTDNQSVSSGQPNLEEFTDRSAWETRLTELGVTDLPEPAPEPTKALNKRQEREIKRIETDLKEENKRLKAELKLQRDRVADATDFNDLKTKLTKVKDSEAAPTKWKDKLTLLGGEKIKHKGVFYKVLADHTASKDAEPPNAPELYKKA